MDNKCTLIDGEIHGEQMSQAATLYIQKLWQVLIVLQAPNRLSTKLFIFLICYRAVL